MEPYRKIERSIVVENLLKMLPESIHKKTNGSRINRRYVSFKQKLLRTIDFSNEVLDPAIDLNTKREQLIYNEEYDGILYKMDVLGVYPDTKLEFMMKLFTIMYSQIEIIENVYRRLEYLIGFRKYMYDLDDGDYKYWNKWINSSKSIEKKGFMSRIFSRSKIYYSIFEEKISDTREQIVSTYALNQELCKTQIEKFKAAFSSEFLTHVLKVVSKYTHKIDENDIKYNNVLITGYWDVNPNEYLESPELYACFKVYYKLYEPSVWYIDSIKFPDAYKCMMSGTEILEKIIKIGKQMGITQMILIDASFIYVTKTDGYSLSMYNILKKGASWYSSYGFKCIYDDDAETELVNNDIKKRIELYRTTPIKYLKRDIRELSTDTMRVISDAVNELGPGYIDKSISEILTELSPKDEKNSVFIMGIVQISNNIFSQIFNYDYCTTRVKYMEEPSSRGGKKNRTYVKKRSKKNRTLKKMHK